MVYIAQLCLPIPLHHLQPYLQQIQEALTMRLPLMALNRKELDLEAGDVVQEELEFDYKKTLVLSG